jgi:hypothetical protein
MRAGALGNTDNVAASAHDSSLQSRPKYRHDAACSPTIFPPKGAFEAYNCSISCFEYRASNLVARIISMIFS